MILSIVLSFSACRNSTAPDGSCTPDGDGLCLVLDELQAPTNIATTATTSTINITWTRDSYGSEFVSLVDVTVEYKLESQADYTVAATVAEDQYELTNLQPNTVYNIRLKSVTDTEESDYSSEYTATTLEQEGDDMRALPQSLTATLMGSSKVLTWNWSNTNYIYTAGVLVQRKQQAQPDSSYTTVTTVSSSTQTYTDTQSTTGAVVYRIWVNYNSGFQSAASNTSNAVTVITSGFTKIVAGYYYSCGITAAGAAKCWGTNGSGQLGNGTTTNSSTPVQVTGLTSGVTSITVGTSGLSAPSTCAVVNGAVKCWGGNGFGQVGNGTTTNALTPVQVSGITSGATMVDTGGMHTCAIVSGAVKCWGRGLNGQLGNNATTNSLVPVNVTGLTGVTSLSMGDYHSCAVASGSAKCWGYNQFGQLGNSSTTTSTTPVQVTNLNSGVSQITAGANFSCAIVSGSIRCWGMNGSGQLGNGLNTSSTVQVQVTGITSGALAVDAGTFHACAVASGSAKCWGGNLNYGQLGNGTTTDSNVPVQVTGLTSNVSSISAGYTHSTCVQSGDGKAWGSNSGGALGNGNNTGSFTAVNVLN
jgi:alpha-tubulin suppressor-like RCC1 family protein